VVEQEATQGKGETRGWWSNFHCVSVLLLSSFTRQPYFLLSSPPLFPLPLLWLWKWSCIHNSINRRVQIYGQTCFETMVLCQRSKSVSYMIAVGKLCRYAPHLESTTYVQMRDQ
jgi:hypothetical protein